MAEVEVWEIVTKEELERARSMGWKTKLGKVKGKFVTPQRLGMLLDWFEYYGKDWGLFWKFRDEGPHAKAYAKWMKKHLDFWVEVGAMEMMAYGLFGGIGYRITEEGLEILRAFIPTIEVEEVRG